MVFSALFNVFTGLAYFPQDARFFVRVFAGAFVGARMSKSDLLQLKLLIVPSLMLVAGMLALNVTVGYALHYYTGLDLATALLASAPGGVHDMALIAEDMGANAAKVAAMQTLRIVVIISFMPLVIRALTRKSRAVPAAGAAVGEVARDGVGAEESVLADPEPMAAKGPAFARTALFAAVGGFALYMTGIPGGAMIGAVFGTIAGTMLVGPSYVPKNVRLVTRICAGALIGSSIGMADILGLKEIILPATMLLVALFAACIGLGILIHKTCKLDLVTSLFASSAGGLVELALAADEMGGDAVKVSVLQMSRIVCVVVLAPTIISILTSFAA